MIRDPPSWLSTPLGLATPATQAPAALAGERHLPRRCARLGRAASVRSVPQGDGVRIFRAMAGADGSGRGPF